MNLPNSAWTCEIFGFLLAITYALQKMSSEEDGISAGFRWPRLLLSVEHDFSAGLISGPFSTEVTWGLQLSFLFQEKPAAGGPGSTKVPQCPEPGLLSRCAGSHGTLSSGYIQPTCTGRILAPRARLGLPNSQCPV